MSRLNMALQSRIVTVAHVAMRHPCQRLLTVSLAFELDSFVEPSCLCHPLAIKLDSIKPGRTSLSLDFREVGYLVRGGLPEVKAGHSKTTQHTHVDKYLHMYIYIFIFYLIVCAYIYIHKYMLIHLSNHLFLSICLHTSLYLYIYIYMCTYYKYSAWQPYTSQHSMPVRPARSAKIHLVAGLRGQ